jgi:antitoxin CptB
MSAKYNFQKVRWHSRRGLLELDLVLVPFADERFQALSEQEQDGYVRLLETEDQDLLSWVLGHSEPVDGIFTEIIQLIRHHRLNIKG